MTTEQSNEADARLAQVEAAYAAGDFASVRAQCAALGAASDPATQERARVLAQRVTPDLAAWLALSVSFALFAGIVVVYAP